MSTCGRKQFYEGTKEQEAHYALGAHVDATGARKIMHTRHFKLALAVLRGMTVGNASRHVGCITMRVARSQSTRGIKGHEAPVRIQQQKVRTSTARRYSKGYEDILIQQRSEYINCQNTWQYDMHIQQQSVYSTIGCESTRATKVMSHRLPHLVVKVRP